MNLKSVKSINLIEFANRHYNLGVQASGQALCPFHKESRPSFSVYEDEGTWLWKDHHDEKAGSIIDLVMELEKIGVGDAIKRIKFLEGIEDQSSTEGSLDTDPIEDSDIVRTHDYLDAAGVLVWQKVKLNDGSFRCRRRVDGKWVYNLAGIAPIPYRLNEIKDQPCVFICEGEKDADTLSDLGYFATSGPFGKSSWPDELTPWFAGKDIRIIYDVGNDDAGRGVAFKLSQVSDQIELLLVPLEAYEADVSDYLEQFSSLYEKRGKFAEIVVHGLPYIAHRLDNLKCQLVGLDRVEPERVEWLWQNRFPLGKLSLICGDPGAGKSYFSIFMAAHVSTGTPWPDRPEPLSQGSVIILTAEDGLADTVRPRADANNADNSRIKVLDGIKIKDRVRSFNLIDHVPDLREAVQALNDVRLIIIDPISAYMGKTDSNKNADVRGALAPLCQLAEKHRLSIIGITHLNKDVTKKAVYRAMGSLAFIATARAVWFIAPDEKDRQRRLFLPIKTNLSVDPQGLAFRIEGGRLVFEEDPIDIPAEEFLPNDSQEGTSALKEACEWLRQALADGPLSSKDCFRMAKENSVSDASLKRAKRTLGVESFKQRSGTGFCWMWKIRVPEGDQDDPTSES